MKQALAALALAALAGCPPNKPGQEDAGSIVGATATASAAVTPSVTASAAPPPPAAPAAVLVPADVSAAEKGLAELRAKYDAPIKELVAAVAASIEAEKKAQAGGAKKFRRVPLPAAKLTKDPSVLQIDVLNTNEMSVDVAALNGSPAAGYGKTAIMSADKTARCPSEYTNEPAADLLITAPFTATVAVKTDACKSVLAERDQEVARVQKMVGANSKLYVDHALKIPKPCEAGPGREPEISNELRALGVKSARVTCRKPGDSSWAAFGVYESKYDRKPIIKQPAWRAPAAGIPQVALFLTDDVTKGKPFKLTLVGQQAADKVELSTDFYLE